MTELETRPTLHGDVPALQRVLQETGLFPAELLPEMLEPNLNGEASDVWLTALSDGNLVGFGYAKPEEMTDGTWNLLAIAVSPEAQGKGVGAALLSAIEHRLAENGMRLLIVDTSGQPEYDGARKFYLARGYEHEARIRDFWAEGDDKITFRKKLTTNR